MRFNVMPSIYTPLGDPRKPKRRMTNNSMVSEELESLPLPALSSSPRSTKRQQQQQRPQEVSRDQQGHGGSDLRARSRGASPAHSSISSSGIETATLPSKPSSSSPSSTATTSTATSFSSSPVVAAAEPSLGLQSPSTSSAAAAPISPSAGALSPPQEAATAMQHAETQVDVGDMTENFTLPEKKSERAFVEEKELSQRLVSSDSDIINVGDDSSPPPFSMPESPTEAPSVRRSRSRRSSGKVSKFNRNMTLKDMLRRTQAMLEYLARSKRDLTVYTHKPLDQHECLGSIRALETNLSQFQEAFSSRAPKV